MKYLKNTYVQIILALLVGIFAGSLLKDQKISEVETSYEKNIESLIFRQQNLLTTKQEEIDSLEKTSKEYKEETTKLMTSLRTENYSLRQKITKSKFKLIKPDGTIIEKEYEESDTNAVSTIVTSIKEEFNQKISSIEEKWKSVHVKRLEEVKKKYTESLAKKEQEIATLKKKEVVNPKSLRPEIGVTTNKELYIHTTYPVWGPLIIGAGGSLNKEYDGNLRVGLGLEF